MLAGGTGAIAAAVSMMAGTYLDVETANDQAAARRHPMSGCPRSRSADEGALFLGHAAPDPVRLPCSQRERQALAPDRDSARKSPWPPPPAPAPGRKRRSGRTIRGWPTGRRQLTASPAQKPSFLRSSFACCHFRTGVRLFQFTAPATQTKGAVACRGIASHCANACGFGSGGQQRIEPAYATRANAAFPGGG